MRKEQIFTGITSQGGLLPADFLAALSDPKSGIDGLDPLSYRLAPGERLGEQVNRSWNRLKGCWANFQRALAAKESSDPTTTETRERWLLPLFQELDFGRLPAAKPLELDGRTYSVSHGWGPVPIHLVGSHVDLDRRTPGAVGAAKASPHSLVQQVLNASDDHLWGILSNGFIFRLLRDNLALTRQAYVEWDLQAIFDGDLYPEFFLLWLTCHQSRFEFPPGGRPEQCRLEKWRKQAEDTGLRALENLRPGVEQAIAALGAGLISHKSNQALREKLRSGALSTQDFYRQILRLIYRLLFLLVAEDRSLLHPPLPGEEDGKDALEEAIQARRRYDEFYSISRLRFLTRRRAGTSHPDLWQVFQFVTRKLGTDVGCPELALPAPGSFLWNAESTPDLNQCLVANRHFLEAVHSLAYIREGDVRRIIDYKNLGSEELGSVYESLLELHPIVNADTGTFELQNAAGHERRTSGSYYTPDSLVQCLLDSALESVMDEAVKGKEGLAAAEALLKLKICDPAVGSGHFLIAAAHRLAKRVAAARTGEEEPSPEATRTALRDVIGRCLYGVDINPMAAELCRVNLWLEALEPGKPLSFLDHHIRVGNSLLGAAPELIAAGLPDEAFAYLEGDNKKACAILKKRNKAERKSFGPLFAKQDAETQACLQQAAALLEKLPDDRPEEIRAKELTFRRHEQTEDYRKKKLLADAWCSAFIIKKEFHEPNCETSVSGLTQNHLNDLAAGRSLFTDLTEEVESLAEQHRFFHWHLAFPEVIGEGGFDCVLGNPPWERVKLQNEEWFAANGRLEIANAPNASIRQRLIRALKDDEPELYERYQDALRLAEAESSFFRGSGAFPLSGTGDVNTFAVFTELATRIVAPRGNVGLIIPTGLATDDQLQHFFATLINDERLVSLTGFENEEFFFQGIANVVRYCAITISGKSRRISRPIFSFYIRNADQLRDEDRYFSLTHDELNRLNPNTRTCPIFRTRFDADLTLRLYDRFPILRSNDLNRNPWDLSYLRMFDMANDSGLFLLQPSSDSLPLYEAKLFWHYDHRFGSYEFKGILKGKGGRGLPDMPLENHQNPHYKITPKYWVNCDAVTQRLPVTWKRKWLLVFRDVSSAKVERTLVGSFIPISAVGHTAPVIFLGENQMQFADCFLGAFNSLVVDYIARQKIGGTHVSYYHLDQLPFPRSSDFSDKDIDFIRPRVIELSYTAEDLQPLAKSLGWNGNPFKWDQERRFCIQCEIDAYFAHFFGLSLEEWLFILDPHDIHGLSYPGESFRVLKEKEIERFGEYRTKQVCLQVYNELARAKHNNTRYISILDPAPGSPQATW